MKIDKKIIKELTDYLEEFNLTELEYSEKDTKVKVSKKNYPLNNKSTITNEKLRIIAKDLRVFSFLSNREEKKKYQDKTIEREQWVKYLNKPPITTACILRCIIQPDAAKINGPGSYMKKLFYGFMNVKKYLI